MEISLTSSNSLSSVVIVIVIWVLSISGIMDMPFFMARAENNTRNTTATISTTGLNRSTTASAFP